MSGKLHNVLICYDECDIPMIFLAKLNDEEYDLALKAHGLYINSIDMSEEEEEVSDKFYHSIICRDEKYRFEIIEGIFNIPPNTTFIRFGFLLDFFKKGKVKNGYARL